MEVESCVISDAILTGTLHLWISLWKYFLNSFYGKMFSIHVIACHYWLYLKFFMFLHMILLKGCHFYLCILGIFSYWFISAWYLIRKNPANWTWQLFWSNMKQIVQKFKLNLILSPYCYKPFFSKHNCTYRDAC